MILEHVNIAAVERFASGEIAVTDIVPIYERTLRRVLGEARTAQPRRTRARRPPRTGSPAMV